ncbi:MAG TPA: alpha-glucan family phosphorylase [Desulfomonilaceae bacterium]|nr:alpha-glucan family phosphorylase [Desulfomonilaceae bacterium]
MPLKKYVVIPPMKGGLESLREIAGNFWFSWNTEAVELFNYVDEHLWQETNHNPLQTLIRLSRHRLKEIGQDEGFLAHSERVRQRFRAYMNRTRSYDYRLEQPISFTTAYFSLEFGVTECLPVYSGGLGLLAGDHLKSASDLNLPLVGVGLMYQEGYFHQSLSVEGWQQEYYPRTEFDTLPLERQTDSSGATILISVDLAGETVWCRILKAMIGRVPLFLLDADIPENPQRLRTVTARLYGGDAEMRIRQEILLGIGGCRGLEAMGITPTVYHLNEGHAAFVLLERMRYFVEQQGLSPEEAREMVTSQSVLTIHTPVPAGNDVFDRELMEKYFRDHVARLGLDFETVLGLGRRHPDDVSEGFCMPVLGLRLTSRTNGVSRLHGRVTRDMWHEVFPNADREDVPITPVTNGVHIPSYISRELVRLYDRYLGLGWTEDPDNEKIWQRADKIPDTELWRSHERCRTRLVSFARRRLVAQFKARNASARELEQAEKVLDPDALTICFARRFATYKRATLLFREPERLARILGQPDRPVQLIFSGKAHPADDAGKELIRKIVELMKEEPFRGRIAFIEDYDINVARYMVQGADVWLNTPRRPLEACGTSGMKASANGALNLSVLDGWWDEGYLGDNGWAIGSGEEYGNPAYQDDIESRALYDLLEESVKPLFFERGADDVPREWIRMMKRSIMTICPVFNSHRMVSDYIETAYVPANIASTELSAGNYTVLRDMVSWKKKIEEDWPKISIKSIEVRDEHEALNGKDMEVNVIVKTAGHSPEELNVELLHGPVDLWDKFKVRHITRLAADTSSPETDDEVLFSGFIPLSHTGLYGYLVQITPDHPNLAFSHRFDVVHRD